MIKSVHLKNFKCFEDQKIEFAPITVLSGLNGMGKSTVIQALLLLRQSYMQVGLNYGHEPGLALNGDLIGIGTGQDALFQKAEVEEIGFEIETFDGNQASWLWGYKWDADKLPLLNSSIDKEIFSLGLFTNQFHYLCAERLGPRNTFETSNFRVVEQNEMGVHGEYAVHFLAVHSTQRVSNSLRHPSTPESGLQSQVNAWLNTISPGIRLATEEYANMGVVRLSYQVVGGGELSSSFRSTNVGFGLTNVLPVVVAILSSKPGTILLIENPEAHLHPRGQSHMGKLLSLAAASGIQVIVETHSDHLLNGIRLSVKNKEIEPNQVQLHFFERKFSPGGWSHSLISPHIDKNGRLDIWPEGFFDEWDRCLDELL